MKKVAALLGGALFATGAWYATAAEIKTVAIGDAEIVYDYETTESGVALLTLIGFVAETNNALRGLKNSDPRRLSKLGQLIYQCKLVVNLSDKPAGELDAADPVLIAKNFGLFTGVDVSLAADERADVRVEALQVVDAASLFSDTLGNGDSQTEIWQTLGDGVPVDLRQLDVSLLEQADLIGSSESIDITIRFPVFQLEQPVNRWSYNFALRDFKQAVRQIDADCTPTGLSGLIEAKN